jgi:hypothetical protein
MVVMSEKKTRQAPPSKPSQEDERRQAAQEYLEDHRSLQEKLCKKLN